MSGKLWALNLALAAVVVFAGVRFRSHWRATHARESAVLEVRVKPAPPPPFTPVAAPPPVTPSAYAQIAMRTLFDPSRNPNVVVEVPPPPPPPAMPPLPLCYGVMNFGDGPAAILAENVHSTHQFLHPGQTIGQFKLLSVNTDEIVLDWDGKEIHKPLVEEAASSPDQPQQQQAQADNTPPPPPAQVKAGPGEDTGRGFRICAMNDGVAEGAVMEGYRKVVYHTPFGAACRYEPAQ